MPPSSRRHMITTDPAGAQVVRDGVVLGTTPYELELAAHETAEIDLRMAGRRGAHQTIAPDAPGTVHTALARRPGRERVEFPGLADR